MTIQFTSGSTTSTASEVNLFDITADEHFATWIFTHNMLSGDTVVIKVYVKDQNAGTMRLYLTATITNAQTDPAYHIPFVPTKQYRVTIQRTGGTDRAYTWLRAEVI